MHLHFNPNAKEFQTKRTYVSTRTQVRFFHLLSDGFSPHIRKKILLFLAVPKKYTTKTRGFIKMITYIIRAVPLSRGHSP